MSEHTDLPLKPLFDRILVRLVPPEAVTQAGLIIPDTAQALEDQGVVVAVGHGLIDKHGHVHVPPVQNGDLCLFRSRGTRIEMNGVEYGLFREDQILGIFREEEPSG